MADRTAVTPSEPPLVLFDVDGVLSDGSHHCAPRPGIVMLCDMLALLGYELVAWSAGGAEHARDHVERCGLHGSIRRYLDKPDAFPPSVEEALALIGRRPILQIDDDAEERIGDWLFMLVETWTPP